MSAEDIFPKRKRRPGYWVFTWDIERRCWSPQIGVKAGPYRTAMKLRKPIRQLRQMGYGYGRRDMLSVLITECV